MAKHVEAPPAHAVIAGRPVRLGKRPVKKDKRTLQLARYLIDPVTGKKVTVAKLPRLKSKVERSQLVPSWGMMENDRFGDCTCAAVGHALQVASAAASDGSTIHTPTDAEIISLYWATGDPANEPCEPGGPTDDGRAELDVLNYWRKNGVDGSSIEVFASITGKGADFKKMTKYAIDLFGFCYIGVALPKSAQTQAQWVVTRGADAAPGSWGGHAIILVDYDSFGPTCITWGETIKMSWGWYEKYCDEAYAVLTPDWLSHGNVSPEGINVAALLEDLQSITKS